MNNNLIASSDVIAVIGMGATGMSVAKFLNRHNKQFYMLDTRTRPPNLPLIEQQFPDVIWELGPLTFEKLCDASKIVLSPGLAMNDPAIQMAEERGIPVVGDIQLFADHIEQAQPKSPVVAITGSNAKSTVTTLVGEMVRHCGFNVGVGGNLSPPALDLITDEKEYYVLELSSFQLETTTNLGATVAAILNISADHMDRYPSIQAYHAAKQRIFQKAQSVVVNRDDVLTQPLLSEGMSVISFGLDKPDLKHFGLIREATKTFLAQGLTPLLEIGELKLMGLHNVANALAALAIGYGLKLPMAAMLEVLRTFKGLPHRCEWVACKKGVDFINDSKGTNVGATTAAIKGLARLPNQIVLIAGGDGKGADFRCLKEDFQTELRALIALGRDADKLMAVAQSANVPAIKVPDMQAAVVAAQRQALSGDVVLLSPACASLDMFENYIDRGNQFVRAVEVLPN